MRAWAAKNAIAGVLPEHTVDQLARHEIVLKLLGEELAQASSMLKGYERPVRFVVVSEAFTQVCLCVL